MALFKVIHYNVAVHANFKYIHSQAKLQYFSLNSFYGMMYTTGRDAYVSPDDGYWHTPSRMIMSGAVGKVYINQLYPNHLYISQQCKLPRDLVRNSGHKIVRDKDKAKYVVVPRLNVQIRELYGFNVGFVVDEKLHLFNITRDDNLSDFDDDDVKTIIDIVKARVEHDGKELTDIFYLDNFKPFYVQFLPKCDEYEDLFCKSASGAYLPNSYVLDSNVELAGSNTVSVETLEVWRRLNDKNLLEKSIINSDWQEYPCTIAIFLYEEKHSYCTNAIGQWRWLLNQINYFDMDAEFKFGDKPVTPKDWNMLQQWVMHRIGVPETGGFIHLNDNTYLPRSYQKVIMSRVCVAPMKISTEETFDNLLARAENA